MDQAIIIVPAIFIGLPWIIFHYITKWKTAATLTNDDETLLEERANVMSVTGARRRVVCGAIRLP